MKRKRKLPELWNYRLTSLVAGTCVLLFLGEVLRQAKIDELRGLRTSLPELVGDWLSGTIRRTPVTRSNLNKSIINSQNPWRLAPASLNRERVIYNLTSKSGFIDLAWLLVGSGILIYLGATAAAYAFQWQWRQWRRFSQAQVQIVVAGTVRIVSREGVIYISSGKATGDANSQGSQIYAYKWIPVRIKIEYAV